MLTLSSSSSSLVSPFQAQSLEVEKLQDDTATALYFLFVTALHQSLGVSPKRTKSPSALALLSHRLLPLLSEFRELGDPTLLYPSLARVQAACYMLANLLAGSPHQYEANLVLLRWWRCEAGIVGEC